jgi:hypothetical protein
MDSINFSPEENKKFDDIFKLYLQAKSIIIFAEEVDADSKYNDQVWKEIRDAFDHLARVIFDKKLNSSNLEKADPGYSVKNLDKAFGHVYRACYDAAEGAIFSLKSKLFDLIKPYDSRQLSQAVPDYAKDRIIIEAYNEELTSQRTKKDVGNSNASDFNKLIKILDGLKSLNKKYNLSLPHLEEVRLQDVKSAKSTIKSNTLAAIIGGVIVAAIIGIWREIAHTSILPIGNKINNKELFTSTFVWQ